MSDDELGAAVRVLMADVDRLNGQVREQAGAHTDLAAQIAALNRGVAALADRVRVLGRPAPAEEEEDQQPAPWLTVTDQDEATERLADLVGWLGAVYVRYPGGYWLPVCWMWHPWMVAELLALQAAWTAAYAPDRPAGPAQVDWHDRHRPGTVRRLQEFGACFLDKHLPGGGLDYAPGRVPATEQAQEIAAWWAANHGSTAAPAPLPGVIAAEKAHRPARS